MIPRILDGLGDLVEQLTETNERVDHETGKNRKSDCRNQTGYFSNTHLEPLFSPTVAREHNTRITVVKSPDLRQVMFTGCMKRRLPLLRWVSSCRSQERSPIHWPDVHSNRILPEQNGA